jgi:protoporphyrinogen oxidase
VGARSVDLAVLGAGPAGLAAAWRVARRGRSVLVLERSAAVGGMAASFDVAGVRVDLGSHRLHPATPPDLLAELRGLLGDDLQLRSRNGRLRVYGRWLGFPLRAGELVRGLPPGALARIARDALAGPLRPRRESSFAAVLSSRLGPELYGALYRPYAEKLWGLPGERIDAEQARRRVTADSPWKIAGRVLRRGGNGQGRVFWYPRRGFGQLAEALADAATAAGAEIRTSTGVSQVDTGEAGDPGGADPLLWLADGSTVRCGHVFSTVPLPVLARLVTPTAPPPVLAATEGLRFRAMLLVYLVHEAGPGDAAGAGRADGGAAARGGGRCGGARRDSATASVGRWTGSAAPAGRWTPYDAHYLPGPDTPVTRVSEPANYRSSATDPTDRTVLCAELPCTPGDPLWTLPDGDLAELVTAGLARNGLPPVRLAAVEVRRLPHVYPVYEVGYADRLRLLDGWAAGLGRVTTFGRLGLFAHDNTHHALAMAWDAAAALAPDGHRDEAAWDAARARFAHHVVED